MFKSKIYVRGYDESINPLIKLLKDEGEEVQESSESLYYVNTDNNFFYNKGIEIIIESPSLEELREREQEAIKFFKSYDVYHKIVDER